jgi:Flp pilus assembly pilin Flp
MLASKLAAEVRKEITTMVRRLVRSLKGDGGQGLAEYALILALIAIVAVLSLVFLGTALSTLLSMIGHSVQTAT